MPSPPSRERRDQLPTLELAQVIKAHAATAHAPLQGIVRFESAVIDTSQLCVRWCDGDRRESCEPVGTAREQRETSLLPRHARIAIRCQELLIARERVNSDLAGSSAITSSVSRSSGGMTSFSVTSSGMLPSSRKGQCDTFDEQVLNVGGRAGTDRAVREMIMRVSARTPA